MDGVELPDALPGVAELIGHPGYKDDAADRVADDTVAGVEAAAGAP